MSNFKKLSKTPLLLGGIALSPALFITKSLEFALVYGIIFLIALLAFYGLSLVLKKFIEPKYLFVTYAFVILVEITLIEILLDLALPLLIANIGMYISLIAVQLLCVFENQEENYSFTQILKIGSLVLAGLVLTGFVREFFSTFNIAYGNALPFTAGQIFSYGNSKYGLTLFNAPAGGFIVIGLLLGILSIFVKEDSHNA